MSGATSAGASGPTSGPTPGGASGAPALGAPLQRLEGREKVTGAARYAAEYFPPRCVHAWPVPATEAKGRISALHVDRALAEPGVLAVLTHDNAPRLAETEDRTLAVLQSPRVLHRGQHIALVVAETLEAAREGAAAVRAEYTVEPHDVELRADHPGLYVPDEDNGGFDGARSIGDFDTAWASAPVTVDAVYRIPALHNHPMEPHAATAVWDGGRLTVHDSNQGTTAVQRTLAELFGIEAEQVTVIAEHVGGGFGSKGTPRPHVVLAAMAAREVGRPVKLSLPRAQMAAVVGHRAATEQRVRLGARPDGRLTALAHEVVTYRSTLRAFVEQAATATLSMYAVPHARTVHRVVHLDVPSPSWMRAPGECSGMFALESAMDELAAACGVDPVALRVRNEPDTDPDTGRPFSSRHLVECLHEGARRFGWGGRDPRPGVRREGRLLVGTGVAASIYPVFVMPCRAQAVAEPSGRYRVRVNATDIGTGARTVLTQIAARALRVPPERVSVELGCSDLPPASVAGGSSGTASWGWAAELACRTLLRRFEEHEGPLPGDGLTVSVDTSEEVEATGKEHARHAFGAQFAEVTVDVDTGETAVRRLLGVFAAGRVINSRTAHSQFIGAMTMGLSMALMEGSTMDPAFGDHAERDLASYHIAACADVRDIQAHWLEEEDRHLNPMGAKGIGEIGIVGTAAAIANAVHHATGVRVRTLPIHPDKVLSALEEAARRGG
ncbi:xanthine dehydrogenase family protein molybdopterin-binding subunit [Wenjunlia tyrosinilytica]|uniref:Xanthine dehydrogenase n=1 Tax=Wenjunlia tyrosinilytica TaxID=1544741 RepID=A0A917ZMR8_9ACTN|nr:xanthine dehydrogenase family protein molybdopterin-binding subunit [Wenjunlia tyrosinilytica]GGO87451.1 xanthine dehydrogenase [Wenjunlia tyrosinilytica]